MRNTAIAAGAGLLSFVFLALVATGPGGVLFGPLAPLPLFAVGLSLGLRPLAVAGAAFALPALALGGIPAALGGLVVLLGPVGVLVRQALLSRPGPDGGMEWYPPGLLVAWLTLIGLAIVALSLGVLWVTGDGGLHSRLSQEMQAALAQVLPELPADQVQDLAGQLAPFAIGLSAVSWLLVLAADGALAQALVSRLGAALRPAPQMAELELPRWMSPVLAVSLVAAYLAPGDFGFAARNFAMVLLLPFFFAGLAVVHAFARHRAARGILLAVFYGAIVLFTWLAVLVTGLGLLDQLAGLRRRFAAGGQGREDE